MYHLLWHALLYTTKNTDHLKFCSKTHFWQQIYLEINCCEKGQLKMSTPKSTRTTHFLINKYIQPKTRNAVIMQSLEHLPPIINMSESTAVTVCQNRGLGRSPVSTTSVHLNSILGHYRIKYTQYQIILSLLASHSGRRPWPSPFRGHERHHTIPKDRNSLQKNKTSNF